MMGDMESLLFESRDLGRTEAFLNRAYTKMRIGGSAPDVKARISRATAESMSVDRLEIGFEMSYDADPLGKICLCEVTAGRFEEHATDGWEDSFGPGELFSLAPPDQPYRGTVSRSAYSITMFDPALLTRVAGVGRRDNAPVTLLDHRPYSPAAARHLSNTISYLGDKVLPSRVAQASPLLLSSAAQLLASSVLAAFPNTTMSNAEVADRRDAHPKTVQRALSFMDSNVDQDVSIADIAAAAGVTVRAVQTAFQRHLGTSPLAHLRRLRLAEVRTELLTADPASRTVAQVATRWGFHNHGRMAAAYREQYGETPSATLARGA